MYDPDQWREHLNREASQFRVAYGVVGLVGLGLAALLAATGRANPYTLGVVAAFLALIGWQYFTRHQGLRAAAAQPPEVVISRGHVRVGDSEVKFHTVRELDGSLEFTDRRGRPLVRVPVPWGREEEARTLVQDLRL